MTRFFTSTKVSFAVFVLFMSVSNVRAFQLPELNAQVGVAKIDDHHLSRQLKSVKQQLKKYRKHKDSLSLKKLLSEYNTLLQSKAQLNRQFTDINWLNNLSSRQARRVESVIQRAEKLKSRSRELTQYEAYLQNDSSRQIAISEALESQFEKAANSYFGDDMPGSGMDGLKQLETMKGAMSEAEKLLEGSFEYSPKELEALKPDAILGPLQKQGAKVNDQMLKLSDLKKKYTSVPDISDLSSAVRRSSLHELPFKERLMTGLDFRITPYDRGVGVDFNPSLGYRINKKFNWSLGGTYRANLGTRQAGVQTMGLRTFSRYTIFSGFFIHGEWEHLASKPQQTEAANADDQLRWDTGLMIGLGKRVTIMRKLNASFSWLYNFNHRPGGPYGSPWVVRFGLELIK